MHTTNVATFAPPTLAGEAEWMEWKCSRMRSVDASYSTNHEAMLQPTMRRCANELIHQGGRHPQRRRSLLASRCLPFQSPSDWLTRHVPTERHQYQRECADLTHRALPIRV